MQDVVRFCVPAYVSGGQCVTLESIEENLVLRRLRADRPPAELSTQDDPPPTYEADNPKE